MEHMTSSVNTAAGADDAPAFAVTQAGGRYPLDGVKIGPLWRRMWAELADGQPRAEALWTAELGPAYGVLPHTARGLLRQACKLGLLVRELGPGLGQDGRMYHTVATVRRPR